MKCKTQKKRQYHNKYLAENAMLDFYKEKGAEAFGSYQCPFCFYWHITSEYDNRSRQAKHRFRCYLEHEAAERRKTKKKAREKNNQIPLAVQKEIFKTFTPTIHKQPSLICRLKQWITQSTLYR